MINFNFIDRQELYDSLKINEDIKITKMNYGDFSYLYIKNFFKTPERAIELLTQYPALNDSKKNQKIVYTPGARQNLTPMDLVPVLKAYKVIMSNVGRTIDPTRFITSSNIMYREMLVWDNSWYPHTDYDLVCNLWLCDYEGGTAFYKYKGFLNQKNITPNSKACNPDKLVSWQNFEGDDDWELYYVIPSEFNTVAIYDGTNFHSVYANFNEEYRYSLISFYQLNAPIY